MTSNTPNTIAQNANSRLIRNAALTARSRRRVNNTPRIFRWMEDTEEQSSIATSFHLEGFPKPSRSLSPVARRLQPRHPRFSNMSNTSSHDELVLPDGFSQASTLLQPQQQSTRPSSPASSISGSTYSCPEGDVSPGGGSVVDSNENDASTDRRRQRPDLSIDVKPSPYLARYVVHHEHTPVPTPRLTPTQNKSPSLQQAPSPYGPETIYNGFPWYEPRAPAAVYARGDRSPRYSPVPPPGRLARTSSNSSTASQRPLPSPRPPTRGKSDSAQRSFTSMTSTLRSPPPPGAAQHQHTVSLPALPPVFSRHSVVHVSRKSSNSVPQLELLHFQSPSEPAPTISQGASLSEWTAERRSPPSMSSSSSRASGSASGHLKALSAEVIEYFPSVGNTKVLEVKSPAATDAAAATSSPACSSPGFENGAYVTKLGA